MDIRKLKADEYEQAIQLSDNIFRDQDHVSMGKAFPHVFSKELQQSFGAFEGNKLVSFIGLVPSKIHLGSATLNTFSIGSVCTKEDYRKKGISSAILQKVYEYIDKAEGTLLFISGSRGLYLRNHCYPFGKSYQYTICKEDAVAHHYAGSIRKGSSADIFKVDQIRREKEVRFDSSVWEWATLLDSGGYTSVFKMKQTLFIAEAQHLVEGYVVVGLPNKKSKTKHAIVTEWGGSPEAVSGILHELLATEQTKEIKINIPWHETYNELLNNYPYKETEHSGTIYLVNAQRLIEQAKPYFIDKNPLVARSFKINQTTDQTFELAVDDSSHTLVREELMNILFSFQKDSRFNKLEKFLPIPLPATDGMNYV